MRLRIRKLILMAVFLSGGALAYGQARTVVFYEDGFPSADTSAAPLPALKRAFASADFVSASDLPSALSDAKTDLLVMPYGSSYPEDAWPAILRYLDRGGNLIVLGGRPFTRAAFKTDSNWRLRAPSVAESLELFIDDYQQTPGSKGLTFEPNLDVTPQLPQFSWKRGFSPVIRLSVVDLYREGGATGGEDADLTTLAWGDSNGHRLAAPAYLIDHNRYRFVGGRWIFVSCDLDPHAYSNAQMLSSLLALVTRRNDRFTFRPRLPLFLPGEALEFNYLPSNPLAALPSGDRLKIKVTAEKGGRPLELTVPADPTHTITLPTEASDGQGLHTVEATLLRGGQPIWTYRSAFWMRDWDYLLSGPKLSVGSDYFQWNGKPLPVVGTTYMSSDEARLYLMKPNAYVWDQDMAQIRGEGLNMIRTGLWTAWAPELAPNGEVSDSALRTIEAFLMCARHNNLPVQFNLFAFLPDSFGGVNAYLDPSAWHAQALYAGSLVKRFHNVPFLAWDLINEPSATSKEWKNLPAGDPFEQAAWRTWLAHRYPDRAALLDAWAEPSFGIGRQIQPQTASTPPEVRAADPLALPSDQAFNFDAVRSGYNPLKVYDYYMFSQSVFVDWVKRLKTLIRSTGSEQLITVGQDQGGVEGRLSPAFYSPDLDFTADHTWWDFDSALWGTLAAKFPGKPVLIQETGEQRRLLQDGHLRLSAQEESWQLERKVTAAFAQGAGALEWVWNVNAYMPDGNEVPIGAVRPDGTEKPEAQVLAGLAAFAAKSPNSFQGVLPPEVTIVTSQALQYSGMNALAIDMQKHALRAIAYYDHTPVRMLPENRVAELGHPSLVILPAPQAFSEDAWQLLLQYVDQGGYLLVTGPVSRNEHWQTVDRTAALGVTAKVLPLDVRQSELLLPGHEQPYQGTFPTDVQQAPIELLSFADGKSVESIDHGKGHILWVADPVEFSEGYGPTAALYSYALKASGVKPAFQSIHPLSPGVLAFPTVFQDAVLYCFSSESFQKHAIDLRDSITGAHIKFELPAQRGAMLLLRRPDGAVLASYGAAAEAK